MKCTVLLAVAASACDPLVDVTYTGQPLLTLEGTIEQLPCCLLDGFQLGLLWQDPRTAGGPGVEATGIPFEFDALGSFTAEVPAQPPAAAWFAFDDAGPRLSEAYFHLVHLGPLRAHELSSGSDPAHVLVYAERDVAGGAASEYLGGYVVAGYHLRRLTVTTEPTAAQRELIERCVANTGDRIACEARRAYRLDPVDDATALRIVVESR